MPSIEHHLGGIQRQAFILPAYFDYTATFLWAISGALLGARRGYAILGIATVALVSSVGGGLLRDGIFLQTIPVLLKTPIYLYLVALAVMLVVFFGARVQRWAPFPHVLGMIDALGLGAYAVVGMNRALAADLSLVGVLVVGVVNAVGGGILRDVLNREEPDMFKPGTLDESLAVIGCAVFIALIKLTSAGQFLSAWVTIAVVFAIRLLAVRYKIRSTALPGFKEYWAQNKTEE
jgi:uncharacterized membrane protein YeiH